MNDQDNHEKTELAGSLPQEATRHQGQNDHRVEQALDRHKTSVMPAIFKREERKVVQTHLTAELVQGFEHRREALSMVLETRLHSIREACNHVLVTGKTQLREERIEYFASVYRGLEKKMSQLVDEFLSDMDHRFDKLNTLKSEMLRQREQQRLERSVDDFLATLDNLMAEFRNIVAESVNHQPERRVATDRPDILEESS